jgi:hypothetical protein
VFSNIHSSSLIPNKRKWQKTINTTASPSPFFRVSIVVVRLHPQLKARESVFPYNPKISPRSHPNPKVKKLLKCNLFVPWFFRQWRKKEMNGNLFKLMKRIACSLPRVMGALQPLHVLWSPAWVTTLGWGPQNMEDLRGVPLSCTKIGFPKVQKMNNHLHIITLSPSSFCGFPFFF